MAARVTRDNGPLMTRKLSFAPVIFVTRRAELLDAFPSMQRESCKVLFVGHPISPSLPFTRRLVDHIASNFTVRLFGISYSYGYIARYICALGEGRSNPISYETRTPR